MGSRTRPMVHEPGLDIWLDTLVEWNAKMDLTAAKTPKDLGGLMCNDARMLAKVVPRHASVVDVGTGAGAPGLALAIMRPDLHVTLVEPLAKRAAFLRTVIGKLGRTDIVLLPRGVETVEERFEVAMSRATFPPQEWLERARALVRPSGSVWVFLAREAPPECHGFKAVETLTYADEAGPRRLVRYELG